MWPLTSTASTERLISALRACVGDGPFTAAELVDALVRSQGRDELCRALAEVSVVPSGAERVDESLWGPAPSPGELAAAAQNAQQAVDEALAAALADSLTRAQAARRLGISPQAVSKRVAARHLIALQRGREKRFPSWQFHESGVLPALTEVIDAWPGTPLALTTWATSPSPDLGGLSPAHALKRSGGPARVLALIDALSPRAW